MGDSSSPSAGAPKPRFLKRILLYSFALGITAIGLSLVAAEYPNSFVYYSVLKAQVYGREFRAGLEAERRGHKVGVPPTDSVNKESAYDSHSAEDRKSLEKILTKL